MGSTFALTIKKVYSTGETELVDGKDVKITLDKPYLLKQLKDGSFKSTGAGEVALTVELDGLKQTIKIGSVYPNPLENAQIVKGVTYVPLSSTILALGGTASYTASTKAFTIQLGTNAVKLTKGSAKAAINGKAVNLRGAVFEEKGVTYVSADLFSNIVGAKLSWDKQGQLLTIAIGSGRLTAKSKPVPAKSSGTMYAVPAKSRGEGWQQLKGHSYEKTFAIYFKTTQKGTISTLDVDMVDLRPIDLNKRIAWKNDQGYIVTSKLRDLYKLFAALTGTGQEQWLTNTFGKYYEDWEFAYYFKPDTVVIEYLRSIGQWDDDPWAGVTLTPETQVTHS